MSELVAYVIVFLAAATPAVEILLVIPAGIVAGLPVLPVTVIAALGNLSTLVPLLVIGDRLRGWWRVRRGRAADEPAHSRRGQRARRLAATYGLPGLALLGPLLTGVHVAALGAMATGATTRRSLVWFASSLAVWSAAVAVVTVAGVEVFVDPNRLPDLFAHPLR